MTTRAPARLSSPARDRAKAFVSRHQWLIDKAVRTCFEPDRPSKWVMSDFVDFVGSHKWVFARTMPENPHEYTLRRATSGVIFDEAVRFTRQYGFIEYFKGGAYRMLVAGGHKYWTMGSPLGYTILINRKLLAEISDSSATTELPPVPLPLLAEREEYLPRETCEGDVYEFERFVGVVHENGVRRVGAHTSYLDFYRYRYWVVGSADTARYIRRARLPGSFRP